MFRHMQLRWSMFVLSSMCERYVMKESDIEKNSKIKRQIISQSINMYFCCVDVVLFLLTRFRLPFLSFVSYLFLSLYILVLAFALPQKIKHVAKLFDLCVSLCWILRATRWESMCIPYDIWSLSFARLPNTAGTHPKSNWRHSMIAVRFGHRLLLHEPYCNWCFCDVLVVRTENKCKLSLFGIMCGLLF